MREILKSLIPNVLMQRMRALLTDQNRSSICEVCRNQSTVFLSPVNNVEHYYHLIFDLSLPLYCLLNTAPQNVTFIVKEFGIFTDRLQLLFPDRVRIENDEPTIRRLPQQPLLGMNPLFVYYKPGTLAGFRNYVLSTLNIEQNLKPDRVLLIERLPPDPYFVIEAAKKGGGAKRRSIPNHDVLATALQSLVSAPFEFQNIRLETLDFREQIQLFANAAVVIGQHGAGLANGIWMQPKSKMIELSNRLSLVHFRNISKRMEHDYFVYKTSEAHAMIDIDDFVSWLLIQTELTEVFRRP